MTVQARFVDGISTALPPLAIAQEEGAAFLKRNYSGRLRPGSVKLLEKVFSHPSVKSRRFAFSDPGSLVDEDPDERARRFAEWSLRLSAEAGRAALGKAGLEARDVTGLVVNTCTGYLCPGVSTYLIEEMGLSRAVKAYDLVGSGCGGAVPNLQLAGALAAERPGGAVLSVSVEICSCTFQMGDDAGLIISNALFGDGAAAAVVRAKTGGYALVSSASRFAPEYREDIRFVHRNGQLHNRLSARLPGLAAETAGSLVEELLAANGLKRRDISRWAVHPGGENVINAVREKLALADEDMRYSRKVLSELGNMSSATVWFILEEMEREGPRPGDLVLLLAFGAGLSAHACLLKKV
ncbi:MAG: type III polyketide synthase [Elusimicrobia bacterium]|nr:type III polyketide synthase [Elusimicrobiota bacterium]